MNQLKFNPSSINCMPKCTPKLLNPNPSSCACLTRNPSSWIDDVYGWFGSNSTPLFIEEVDSGENGRILTHGWHIEAPKHGWPGFVSWWEVAKMGWWWSAVSGLRLRDHRGPFLAGNAWQRMKKTGHGLGDRVWEWKKKRRERVGGSGFGTPMMPPLSLFFFLFSFFS